MKTNDFTVKEIKKIWLEYEEINQDSFIDFVEDNIKDIYSILDYFNNNYPKLFNYIMEKSNQECNWKDVTSDIYTINNEWKTYSLETLVELYYNVYKEIEDDIDLDSFSRINYIKSIDPWCNLIHDNKHCQDILKKEEYDVLFL